MARKERLILDSFAIIGFLENEPFAGRIQDLLIQGREQSILLYLHAIHLGELYYITMREQGQAMADKVYARVRAFPMTFVDHIDEKLLLAAARIKARYPVSYADSFAAALALIHGCPLATGDPEFGKLEQEGVISVLWLT